MTVPITITLDDDTYIAIMEATEEIREKIGARSLTDLLQSVLKDTDNVLMHLDTFLDQEAQNEL